MSTWLFLAMIHQVLIGWYASNQMSDMPALIGWELPFPFLHGPFLYLYILYLTGQQRYGWRNILHFIPAVLTAIILAPVLGSMSVQEKLGLVRPSGFEWLFQGIVSSIIISGVVYVILSLRLLRRHRQHVAVQFSNTDKITLNWLRYLIGGMGVIWMVVIFFESAQSLYIVVALFIFFIGYFGIRQVGIFSSLPPTHEVYLPAVIASPETPPEVEAAAVPDDVTGEKVKYEKSGLTDTEAIRIHTALTTLMQQQTCYKDPELTLGDLAKTLDVHPAILSQVINSKEGKSFYDYINVHRVEAFKQLLLQPENQQYTLLALAFECGFNSKTSFNRNFKKITQLSPSSYVKALHINIQPGE
ncbi:AraC family transcriptional regulator [Chitinophaga nivalis]|uniref:Helix-turn-helix domain-containing protein n=1 Tax=Chitinophaga nivalis TaxID=2991709 RepID=A0ABT3IML8_9BACT|nr:helix-turn-helix domain-containing protein [Chitinophaga nivalis]MCW3465157.1 helix-turn-helix domain-containing protein [Chitinophaga nivalis]MCW3485151.1 helix-turn-helix domain-containing protein [Chitinophaga nivalis]